MLTDVEDRVQRRNSRQKQRLIELLCSTDSHPTADWLYEKLRSEFPNLSLGTVYRNLRIMSDAGLIRELKNSSSFSRFDARTDQHYHLICKACGNIEDAPLTVDARLNQRADDLNGFKIESHQIDFIGICAECRSDRIERKEIPEKENSCQL